MDLQWVGRLALALVCIGVLISARWRHEQQLAGSPPAARSGAAGRRGGRRAPLPPLPQSLYWMGLTTSAALAAQAIAALVAQAAG